MTQHSAAASIGIPLHCNICPKKPNFSDTSHLLTHVASKQHLSNYFKLRVRVNTDSAAQRDVDAYDRWYQDWNLDELMRERMNQKEKRTRGGNGAASRRGPAGWCIFFKTTAANPADNMPSAAAPQVPSSRSGSVPTSMPQPRRESSLRNNLLDPQLGPKIKTEPNTRPSTPGYIPSYDPMDGQRSYAAPMHGWGSMPYAMSPSQGATSASWASDADDDDDDTSSYGYAPIRTSRRRKMSEENTSWHGSMSGSLPGSAHPGEDPDGVDVPNDIARLKGDIWPGMDIFDSATLEMRRKRNQKKATSVIIQLQATSEMVTPTELIFDNLGQFKKERVISGEPNEADSPLRGETPPEPDDPPVKKRATRRRPRAALTEKDANGGRKLRSSGRSAAAHHPGFGDSHPQYVASSDDLDEDDGLTYGHNRRAQRRSGLSIHRDNTGPDITFDRPSRMSYLTSSFPGPYGNTQVDSKGAQTGYGRVSSQLNDSGYHSQLQQQSYHTQPRPATDAGFRALGNQQAARNLSSFGALASQPLFQTNHYEYNAPQIGSNSFPSFQQHFASVNHMPATAPSFVETGSEMQNWDVFGFNDGALASIDMNFNATETTGANPLFYDGEPGMANDDDEGTISVPASDGSPA